MKIYWKEEGVNEQGYQFGPAWHEVPHADGSITTVPIVKAHKGYRFNYRHVGSALPWVRFPSLYRWCKAQNYEIITV